MFLSYIHLYSCDATSCCMQFWFDEKNRSTLTSQMLKPSRILLPNLMKLRNCNSTIFFCSFPSKLPSPTPDIIDWETKNQIPISLSRTQAERSFFMRASLLFLLLFSIFLASRFIIHHNLGL